MGFFDIFKKESSSSSEVSDGLHTQKRVDRLTQIVDESTGIIQNTKNIDVVISRYETVGMHLTQTDLEVENIDEAMDDLRDMAVLAIKNCCLYHFNQKVKAAEEMKTAKGKANNLIKVIKYYEDNLENVPVDLIEDCQPDMDSCKQAIGEIKDKNDRWTAMLNEAGVEIPDWWKKEWKEELPE